ncbi:GNAT family N-acetyltransferase [Streptomyces lydicus]|uniref:GNAT family N-acetyltransferase n=1 Tax=Streptomyces lydicus TaxID=47763 RepID=UPI0037AC89D9
MSEHAAYERAAPPPTDLAWRLEKLLFGTDSPRLRCFVAELDAGEIIGYASCAPEVSTWDGAEYLHLDCLFLRDGHRGLKVGPCWSTPWWPKRVSSGPDRFSGRPRHGTRTPSGSTRLGAEAKEKRRYHLPVG